MKIMRFQSYYFQLKNGTPVFEKYFCFSENFFKAEALKTFKTSIDCV